MPRTPKVTARAMTTLVAALPLLAGADPVTAQTGNPWTEQYGTQSILLGGAVIGGASDLGLVFYNPARLALVQNPEFVVTARVYQWQRIGLGETAWRATSGSRTPASAPPPA